MKASSKRNLQTHSATHPFFTRGGQGSFFSPQRQPTSAFLQASPTAGSRPKSHLHAGSLSSVASHLLSSVNKSTNPSGSGAGTKPPKPARPKGFSVSTSGCQDQAFKSANIEQVAEDVFKKVRDDKTCIRSDYLRDAVLKKFDGLHIRCNKEYNPDACANAMRGSKSLTFFDTMNRSDCSTYSYESVLLHEVVHTTEEHEFPHGDLAWDCMASCYGHGKGDPTKCTYQRAWLPQVGISGGYANQGSWYTSLYLGMGRISDPVVGIANPELGIRMSFIGQDPNSPTDRDLSYERLATTFRAGARFDWGEPGGGHVSLGGGPSWIYNRALGEHALGGEAGVSAGYKWKWLELSGEASILFDPTRSNSAPTSYMLGASLRFNPMSIGNIFRD